MTAKQYAHALGSKLSPAQENQVIDWLLEHTQAEVAALISAPPPDGFGIPTSTSAVNRFAALHAEEIGEREFDSIDDLLTRVNAKYENAEYFHEDLQEGNFRLIQEKIFRVLATSNPSLQDLKLMAQVSSLAADRLRMEKMSFQKEALAKIIAHTTAALAAKDTAAMNTQKNAA